MELSQRQPSARDPAPWAHPPALLVGGWCWYLPDAHHTRRHHRRWLGPYAGPPLSRVPEPGDRSYARRAGLTSGQRVLGQLLGIPGKPMPEMVSPLLCARCRANAATTPSKMARSARTSATGRSPAPASLTTARCMAPSHTHPALPVQRVTVASGAMVMAGSLITSLTGRVFSRAFWALSP